jgi:transporter family protein
MTSTFFFAPALWPADEAAMGLAAQPTIAAPLVLNMSRRFHAGVSNFIHVGYISGQACYVQNIMTWLTWSLLSAFFAAITAILAKLGVSKVDPNLATAVRTSVVVVFTWLLAYGASGPYSFRAFSNKTWLYLVLSGLATGLSWLCYFHALQIGQASRVAPIDKLSVALVILFGYLFLGERLTAAKGIGGLLIVAGAITIALE